MNEKSSGLSNVHSNDLLDSPIKMTPEQIQNWRKVLVGIIGPYALIMPDEQVHKFRDRFQTKINSVAV